MDGVPHRLEDLIPDSVGFHKIPQGAINIGEQIGKVLPINISISMTNNGQGGFGVVFKGVLHSHDINGNDQAIDVALKELQFNIEVSKFYNFQHEVMIMRYYT